MIAPGELLTIVHQLGIDPGDFAADLAKKAATQTGVKLVGASKAVIQHLVARFCRWRKSEAFAAELAASDEQRRTAILASGFENWVEEQSNDAVETAPLLFRLIYLRALEAHCRALRIVRGAGSSLDLMDVWVPQGVRKINLKFHNEERRGLALQKVYESLSDAVTACGTPMVIVGGAGSGKSTQLRKLVADRANDLLGMADFEQFVVEPIPVYVTARDLVAPSRDLATSLADAVASSLTLRLPFPIPNGFFDPRQPGSPKTYLLVVDGFDEIEADAREQLALTLKSLDQGHSIIIGSRPELCSSDFEQFEILELEPEQARKLVEKLTGRKVARDPVHGKGLLRNPLLLTLATLLSYEELTSYAVIYREFVTWCLNKSSRVGRLIGDAGSIFNILEICAADPRAFSDEIGEIAAGFDLLPQHLSEFERRDRVHDLLLATGIVVRQGDRVAFVHDSFRSYFRAESLARSHRPNRHVWESVSPLREGWETVAFVIEIWFRDGRYVTSALEALLAFGKPGLRLFSTLAARSPQLPPDVITAAVAKWMYRDDDFWDAGLMDGPVQQLTLIAAHYEAARDALRTIASDSWIYAEDAIYAAKGLAEIGQSDEAWTRLIAQTRDQNLYCCHRVLAPDILIDIGATSDARQCLDDLSSEWREAPPDVEHAWMELAEAFHKLGKTRTAGSILRRLSDELTDELDLQFLAESYLRVGKVRQAAQAARRAFKIMNRSKDALRKGDYRATELVGLLDRAGARREAACVRKDLNRSADHSAESLRQVAFDLRQNAKRRLEYAKELHNRGDEKSALDALEILLSDPSASHYERFNAASLLLDSKAGRHRAVGALKRIAEDERWYRVSCGRALASAGIEDGFAILRRVALEPGEDPGNRTKAIEQLACSGRLDLAAAAFRRLSNSGDLNSDNLRYLAEVFAHTPVWVEFLRICEELLSCADAALRVQAVRILMRTPWLEQNHHRPASLLSNAARDRRNTSGDRIDAVHELHKLEEQDAIDITFDITAGPDETMEAGLAAMHYLGQRGERFLALDGGHDVVWDKKLSVDQFIHAGHQFLSAASRIEHEEHAGSSEEIREAVAKVLREIAADPTAPLERRFAAAGLTDEDDLLHKPFWPDVRAIADDVKTPLSDRWLAIQRLLQHDPSLIDHYKPVIEGGGLTSLQAANLFLAVDWRDAASEQFHTALVCETDTHVRISILKQLAELTERHFAGQAAADLIRKQLQALEAEELDPEMLADAVILTREVLPGKIVLDLALQIVQYGRLEGYDIKPALDVIMDLSGPAEVQSVLRVRIGQKTSQASSDPGAFYDLPHLHRLQALYGSRADAARALSDLSGRNSISFEKRVYVCQDLARIGRARDAQRRLRSLARHATTAEHKLSVAEAAIHAYDWTLARQMFLAAARDQTAAPSTRIQAARGLGQTGLRDLGRRVLADLDLADRALVWQHSIEALLACGRHEEAVSLCETYVARDDVDLLDRVEAIAKLGTLYRKDLARSILADCLRVSRDDIAGSARAAEILQDLGFDVDARTTLFGVKIAPHHDTDDRIWLADAMVYCGLRYSARKVLREIDETEIKEEDQNRIRDLRRSILDGFIV